MDCCYSCFDDSELLDDEGVRQRCDPCEGSRDSFAVRMKNDCCELLSSLALGCVYDLVQSVWSELPAIAYPEPLLKPDDAQDDCCCADVEGALGEVGLEGRLAFSRSASLHVCEQYVPLVDCRSQFRQKSWKQSIVCSRSREGVE